MVRSPGGAGGLASGRDALTCVAELVRPAPRRVHCGLLGSSAGSWCGPARNLETMLFVGPGK
ncbi:hypothetical protein ABT324_19335 [Saccharopolyspora sp. NPDC000359]|uniref:hypothetical protein n=1 Tax=Saccharopolyspora sp. NPDC000359 TaxID=3154251 RepID=UPI0033248927